MAKRLLLLIIIVILAGGLYWISQNKNNNTQREIALSPSPTLIPTDSVQKKIVKTTSASIFVPYWAEIDDGEIFADYDRLIYFGITPTTSGISKTDDGYKNMGDFFVKTAEKKTWLTLRMTNSDQNINILNKTASWQKIADDTIEAAQLNGFDGVVIDLELGALASDGLVARINEFMKFMQERFEAKSLPTAVALYGDLFYRKRPYDVKAIGAIADEIIIMGYDFHKSYGEPGPNFPFEKGRYNNYDFKTMIDDYLQVVPADKLTVTFGMYGYDWLVDEVQRPIRQGKPVTLNEVTQKFLTNCTEKNCVVRRDESSAETEVNYVDQYAGFHIVWFEDTDSVKKKRSYLDEKGIGNIAYWAYSFF